MLVKRQNEIENVYVSTCTLACDIWETGGWFDLSLRKTGGWFDLSLRKELNLLRYNNLLIICICLISVITFSYFMLLFFLSNTC